MARTFARSAPGTVDRRRWVQVRVTDMSARDAWWWDTKFGPHHVVDRERVDRFWSWSTLLPMCHLVQLAKRRFCRPLAIWGRSDNGRFVRVALSILIERYPYLDVRVPSDSYFVWFVAAADKRLLKENYGMSNPPALGRFLLDNAMVLSDNDALGGRMGLHAAEAGGQDLLALYRACGLLSLTETCRLPNSIKRRNDGRFFYTDQTAAARLMKNLDIHR